MRFLLRLFVVLLVWTSLVALAQQNSPRGGARGFEAWDKNADGKLTRDELPGPLQKNFAQVDRDGDGFISKEEDAEFRNRMRSGKGRSKGPSLPAGVRKIADLDYAGSDNPKQKLDLYLPENPGSEALPVVCWIHGGGWKSGDKANGGRVARLASTGEYAGVSIAYRLSGEAKWPSQIHDCKAAIRWLRAHAEEYGLDPDRIAVWGSSAGGHLVAMLGTTHGVKGLEGTIGAHLDQSSRVQCVVNFFGPSELLTMDDHESKIVHNSPDSPESLLIGAPIQQSRDKARNASPVTHVSKDDAPSLIVHGTQDMLVPYAQSKTLEEKLEAAGVDTILVTVEEGGHGKGFGSDVQQLVDRFLAKHLRGEKNTIEDQAVPALTSP